MGFLSELRAAEDESNVILVQCVKRGRSSIAISNPRPTRLGNLRAVAEGYVNVAYGVDLDFLWPRLQLVFARDDKLALRVEAAKTQLDSSLLLLLLSILVPTIWLPLLVWKASGPWLFLTIGLGAPLIVAFLHRLVEETQKGFGEILKAAIDGSRLDLLTLLHVPLTPRLAVERETWKKLERALEDGGDMRLHHDSA